MPTELEFTGERFVPGIAGEIAHEHWHRYAFARRYVAGKRVLDVACGEGYGSALLAGVASSVTGIDIDAGAVAHARQSYAALANVSFSEGSAASLPLPDACVDAVVSFETIEHLPRSDQPRMLAENARVLAADGVLLLSAPNPAEYSAARSRGGCRRRSSTCREAPAVSLPLMSRALPDGVQPLPATAPSPTRRRLGAS